MLGNDLPYLGSAAIARKEYSSAFRTRGSVRENNTFSRSLCVGLSLVSSSIQSIHVKAMLSKIYRIRQLDNTQTSLHLY